MMKKELPKIDSDDPEWVFRDLQYTTTAYFAGEQIFPYWETIYAILIAQSYYVFFSTDKPLVRLVACLLGFILSAAWLIIVNENHKFSCVRQKRMIDLAHTLQRLLAANRSSWTPFDVWDQQQKDIPGWPGRRRLVSSSVRRAIPVLLTLSWLVLSVLLMFWPNFL